MTHEHQDELCIICGNPVHIYQKSLRRIDGDSVHFWCLCGDPHRHQDENSMMSFLVVLALLVCGALIFYGAYVFFK